MSADKKKKRKEIEKPGNSGENSNGTVHLGGSFPEKKGIPFEVLLFPVFTETTEIFCTVCLDY